MKKFVLFLVIALALMLTACGAPTAPATDAPAPTAEPAETHDDMSTSAPAPTDAPAATEPPQPQSDGKVPVEVTLGDNWVKSNLTTFKVGVTYTLTITNTGNRTHNFNINRPAEKTTNGINQALAEALLSVPEEQLRPGSVVTVEYTFTEAAPAGTLEFACLIERHYKSGQFLPIIVEP
jgi:uncharacterized cupredoxin-like copper-binding protein